MSAEFTRCFVALVPDTATTQQLQDLPRLGRARPVAPDELHLTVAFWGDLQADKAHQMAAVLPSLVGPVSALMPLGLALWPTPQRARVIVVSYQASEDLLALHQRIEAEGSALGLMGESRDYRPHITVARLPRTLRVMPQQTLNNIPTQLGPARFTHIGLYARANEGDVQRYQTLVEIALPEA